MRPDYDKLRQEAGFGCSAGGSQGAMRALSGVPIREFNLSPAACIEAYRVGLKRFAEVFGDAVGAPGITTPAVSYGHVNCLGVPLTFPEGGEVGERPIWDNLDDGIAALKEPVDWRNTGMFQFYLDFRETLKEAFPDRAIGFGFGGEGPITTAYEVRGVGFFEDMYDRPETTAEFMRLLVASIIDYYRFVAQTFGNPFPNPTGGGMCDDLASFVPPALFERVVLTAWEQYYSGITTGVRSAHVEDLRPEQLPFLEQIGLVRFDPSISHKLNPRLLRDHCRVPFVWRLGSFHYLNMTVQDVRDFVFQSAADGASGVTTVVEEIMCRDENVPKVLAFVQAGREAKQMIAEGVPREEMAELVTLANRPRYWDHWREPSGVMVR